MEPCPYVMKHGLGKRALSENGNHLPGMSCTLGLGSTGLLLSLLTKYLFPPSSNIYHSLIKNKLKDNKYLETGGIYL
jgi:hypothetical protein